VWTFVAVYFGISVVLYLGVAWLVPKRGPLLWELLSLLVLPLVIGASLLYLIWLFLRSPSEYQSR
jgi:hypothetical protein